MTQRIVVLGAGVSGLLAAYHLREAGDVTVVDAGNGPGGNFIGGLKYVRVTTPMMELLHQLDIPFNTYIPRGGIVTAERGTMPWPEGVHPTVRGLYQRIHWLKTRGGSLEGFDPRCMNDPNGEVAAPALAFDHRQFIAALRAVAERSGVLFQFNERIRKVNHGYVEAEDGGRRLCDKVITTLPLPLMEKLAWPYVSGLPKAEHGWTTVASLTRFPDFLKTGEVRSFDYVYTPLDPHVTRMSINTVRGGWDIEVPGDEPDWHAIAKVWPLSAYPVQRMPGHLRPLPHKPVWPSSIVPLGRFAEWDARLTTEKVLARVLQLREML